MNEVDRLIADVETVRDRIVARATSLPGDVVHRRPEPDAWSVAEIIEHLVLAEESGVRGLWRVAERVAADVAGAPGPLSDPLRSRSIEQVFAHLEDRAVSAPDAVIPWAEGRPLPYWASRLRTQREQLKGLGEVLKEVGLERVVLPHFMAGPLDARQRLQFLRWHMERHERQIERTVPA